MLSLRKIKMGAVVVGVLMGVAPAFGAISASATISSTPNGSNFDYTVLLKDTGTTNIGTFWFAWTPPGQPVEYDFLPSAPSSTSEPAGWIGPVSPGFPGNSIEYYNQTGSAIAPGQTGTFEFTTSDSPAVLQGFQFGSFPITESFVYAGLPESGASARVDPVFVAPEPSSLVLAAIGCAVALRRPRRQNR